MTTAEQVKQRRRERDAYRSLILSLYPAQGEWSEEEYLKLTDYSRRLIEFADGFIEVLPMPTDKHQAILRYLFRIFDVLMLQTGGTAFFAALRVQVREGMYREPDLLLLRDANDPRRQDRFWLGADLVVEIVSPDDPKRDTEQKPKDYAEAGIPEYWIVNPLNETITVLTLEGDAYATHGVFARGQQATSALLEGLSVSVDAALDAE